MNISRNYNRGKSFRFSEWETGKVYKNDDYIQDFVKYNGVLYACVAPFTSKRPDYILKHPDIRGDWDVAVDGVGVQEMNIEYGISLSDERPTSWVKDMPETPPGCYLWTKIEYVFKDGGVNISFQKTYISKDGMDGINGIDGKDGVDGVDGITPKFKIENDLWYVSYDDGTSWTETGRAKGEDGTGSSEIAESTEDNKNFIVVETVGEEQAIAVREIDSDKTVLSKPITVAGLSGTFGAGNYKNNDVIPAGTDLYTILQNLLCKENYPTVKISAGEFSAKKGIVSTTITKNSNLVKPGDQITFTIKQGAVNGYTSSDHSVSGLTYGYSLQNDNLKDGDDTSFVKKWQIDNLSSTYTLKIVGGGEENVLTGTSPQSGTCSFKASIGTNTCSVTSSGEAVYVGNIEEIPEYYVVSNIGNTNESNKTTKLSGRVDVEVKSSGTSTSSESITCVYPVYHNVSASTLKDDTITQMDLSTSTQFKISDIPSERDSGKKFIFEFPEHVSIKSMTKTPVLTKYKVYCNISNDTLTDEANTEKAWNTPLAFSKVPSELAVKKHFILEYPAEAKLLSLTQYSSASGKYEEILYTSEPVNRGSNPYIRIVPVGDFIGATSYIVTFDSASTITETESDYTITTGHVKTINGKNYNYSRMIPNESSGIVTRVINLNKALTS